MPTSRASASAIRSATASSISVSRSVGAPACRCRRHRFGADGQQLLRHLPEQRGHPADRLAGPGQKFAFDSDPAAGGVPGSAWTRWDIHDDQSTYSNHAGANPCIPKAGTIDAVDNCVGGGQNGPFSHIYGLSGFGEFGGVGPFDPLRPEESLLPDGKTDAGDAPMPPLRIDLRIAPGGFGGLQKADKDDVYVRNSAVPDYDRAQPLCALLPGPDPGEPARARPATRRALPGRSRTTSRAS